MPSPQTIMVVDDPVLTADNLFMPFISPNAETEKIAVSNRIAGDREFYPNPTNYKLPDPSRLFLRAKKPVPKDEKLSQK